MCGNMRGLIPGKTNGNQVHCSSSYIFSFEHAFTLHLSNIVHGSFRLHRSFHSEQNVLDFLYTIRVRCFYSQSLSIILFDPTLMASSLLKSNCLSLVSRHHLKTMTTWLSKLFFGPRTTLLSLPIEILQQISDDLPPESVMALSLASKRLFTVLMYKQPAEKLRTDRAAMHRFLYYLARDFYVLAWATGSPYPFLCCSCNRIHWWSKTEKGFLVECPDLTLEVYR